MKRKTLVALSTVISATFLAGCQTTQDKGVNYYNGAHLIPQNLRTRPNDETIDHFQSSITRNHIFRPSARHIKSETNPRVIESDNLSSSELMSAMADSSALSYLFYDNGKVIYNITAPQERFRTKINDKTYFNSYSMAKSFVSYLVGASICRGYIQSVDEQIDWDFLDNTIYDKQPLINLLNMRAGDYSVIASYSSEMKNSGKPFSNLYGLEEIKDEISNVPVGKRKYSYSNLATDIVFNYVKFKAGSEYDKLLQDVVNKAGLENTLHIRRPWHASLKSDTGEHATILLTRYDYLRLAIMMLEDWQNDTCEGRYLKSIYQSREPKDFKNHHNWSNVLQAQALGTKYGGYFTTDFKGLSGNTILGMHGHGGQVIMIDMNQSRIVVVNAATEHYDIKTLIYKPLKYGRVK